MKAFVPAYCALAEAAPTLELTVATYFSDLRANLAVALSLSVAAVHLDLVTAPRQLDVSLELVPDRMGLSVGVVDGRNVWRADLAKVLGLLERAKARLGQDRLVVAPSCSLMHLPVDLRLEEALDPEVRAWMAFGLQRLDELNILKTSLNEGRQAVAEAVATSAAVTRQRTLSAELGHSAVRQRTARLSPHLRHRQSPYEARKALQARRLALPLLPTTTRGSFPQTPEVRSARARHRAGAISDQEYDEVIKDYVGDAGSCGRGAAV